MSSAPPAEVLEAFGAEGTPTLLDGGMHRTWLAGDVVLKPVPDPVEHAWVCDVYDTWPSQEVRVPRPLRAGSGWALAGWGAHLLVPGTTARLGDDPMWFRDACVAFHEVAAGVARPAFLDQRDDPWSCGERVAWDGLAPVGAAATLERLHRAQSWLTPVDLPAQAVHGDLGGNLLRDGARPGVIDWPAYWRPAAWALAIVAADAVCWEEADLRVLDLLACGPAWPQLVLRAAIYRLATRGHQEVHGLATPDDDGYLRPDVWDWVEDRL
jgi:uncharacterized protein (TIGR02569 family)